VNILVIDSSYLKINKIKKLLRISLEGLYMKVIFILMFSVFAFGCDKSQEQPTEASQTITTIGAEDKTATNTVKSPSGKIFEYGIYNTVRKGRVVASLETGTGKVVNSPVVDLNEKTTRIPLIKDLFFAYRYRINDMLKEDAIKPVAELRRVLIHPPMNLPNGTTSTGSDRIVKERTSARQVIAFHGYGFHEDYELVEGEWTFQVWYRDEMMVEQKFTTYWPEAEETITDTKAATPAAESKI
jgi:hypothetical protein